MRTRRILLGTARTLALATGISCLVFTACWFLFPFPVERLAVDRHGPAVLDRDGRPLLWLVSKDEQWGRPVRMEEVSPWLVAATLAAEDERFRSHPGVDPVAVVRAIGQNFGRGRIWSGASTITMQVCRMLDPAPRTFLAKANEALRAIQLERRLAKDDILELYLSIAPYGGNIRGAAAASRIWFDKAPGDLSLAEAALLAGLPQSPVRYCPDVNPEAARGRRNVVLARMRDEDMIDEGAYREAVRSPLEVRPLAGASRRLGAPVGRHAAFTALARRPRGGTTTISLPLQEAVEEAARRHAASLPEGSDIAVVVLDVRTGEIRALVGSTDFFDPRDGQVNGALARRSPGSALKPFLFAAAFESGRIGPASEIPDRPMDRAGWTPGNFDPGFSGSVTAAEALRLSLNIPALLVTEAVGVSRCTGLLTAAGVELPADAAERGGLALATGAVETNLLCLTNAYATIARGGTRLPARLFPDEPAPEAAALRPETCAALDAILADEGAEWFMAKTGTSSGRRDAWAVGHNRRFAIGVWAGRFSGRGHPAFTGRGAARPLLARLFGHPALRNPAAAPLPMVFPPAPPLVVRGRGDRGPRILSPANGSVFLSLEGEAIITATLVSPGRGTWLLDGVPASNAEAARLTLCPGTYTLTRVTPDGTFARSSFTVR